MISHLQHCSIYSTLNMISHLWDCSVLSTLNVVEWVIVLVTMSCNWLGPSSAALLDIVPASGKWAEISPGNNTVCSISRIKYFEVRLAGTETTAELASLKNYQTVKLVKYLKLEFYCSNESRYKGKFPNMLAILCQKISQYYRVMLLSNNAFTLQAEL